MPPQDGHPAVFLDRDGTLIIEKHYLHKPQEVEVFAGATEALARLRQANYKLILVTNQSGVGRGYYGMSDVEAVNARVTSLLLPQGTVFDAIYVAPEAPDQPSRGRKPSPQFLFDARDAHGLDLARSYMIGDKLIDLECGWNAGVKKSLLVRTGYGRELEREQPTLAARAVIVDDLAAAADWILKDKKFP